MKAKRLRVIGLLLAGLVLLLAVIRFWPASGPTYRGKRVGVWFIEYAFATNPAPVSNLVLGKSSSGQNVIFQMEPGGRLVTVSSASTNLAGQLALLQTLRNPGPDPAWKALQALGSNAVPHLIKRVRLGALDRGYARVFTNLPMVIQGKLPNPAQKRWYQHRALAAIADLGDAARAATPALLELLPQNDRSLQRSVVTTLCRIHADRRSISKVLLQLGAQHRHREVLDIAQETGWEGLEMAQLLGGLLKSPDVMLRRDAITLLEHAGSGAIPAVQQIIAALGDEDNEVRYMAARCLQAINKASPQVVTALSDSLTDTNVMVQNVSRRTLRKIAPGSLPALQDTEAK
jgi:hypothetical protein